MVLTGIPGIMLVFGLTVAGCDIGVISNLPEDISGYYSSAPSAPSYVLAAAASSGSILVSWNSVSNAQGYYVYRALSSSGQYSFRSAASSTSYTDTGLSSGTTYYYKVSAYNSYGESSLSTDYDSATPNSSSGGGSAPSAPSYVYASAASSSSISVSWASVSNAQGYYVYRASSSSGQYSYRSSASSTSYTDTGLSSGTTYYYKVSAYNSYGESSLSTDYDFATTSSGSTAGSSYTNAIMVGSGGVQGSFPTGLDAVWYKFTKNGSGGISVADRAYSSAWTSDVVIDLFDADLYYISVGDVTISDRDVGNGTTNWVYATNWAGTYYVKVKPKYGSSSNKGTFFIQCPY
jgi:hypothetical protein